MSFQRKFLIVGIFLLSSNLCGGQSHYDREYLIESLSTLSQWIADGQTSAYNYQNRGIAYLLLDSLEPAFNDFTNAIALDSLNSELFYQRGNVTYEMGQYLQSINDYSKAISLSRKNLSFFISRGMAHEKLGNLKLADQDYSYVINIDSTNESALFNRALLYWDDHQRLEQALSDLNTLLRHFPVAKYFYERGQLFINFEKYEKALPDVERALSLEPKNSTYHAEKGLCLGMLGRPAEANSSFSTAERLDKGNVEIYWRRGLWHLHEKKRHLACADFRTAAKLGADVSSYLKHCR